jgi:phage tail sheath protein FI
MPLDASGNAKKVAAVAKPELVTSWEAFKNSFGDIQAGNKTLALAVYGFFDNGGTRCWITRVAKEADLADLTKVLPQFETIDEISMVAAPGVSLKAQQEALVAHCVRMLDRVAILDGVEKPAKLTLGDITSAPTSTFAALYFPWIQVFDPVTSQGVWQPPSGHVAGVCARVDAQRGVFKAPANEVPRGALDVEFRVTRNDQDDLNEKGVNIIRSFDGNLLIWGARTLGGDENGEFKYLSVRRYFNFLRKSIYQGTQFVVFEPNSPALWQRIIRSVSDFLLGQWRDGALFGETAKQAFFVKCDADTNPPDVRARGQVVTEIGVAIVQPAEFVIFRIQQQTGG